MNHSSSRLGAFRDTGDHRTATLRIEQNIDLPPLDKSILQPLEVLRQINEETALSQTKWAKPTWAAELHQIAAYVRECQHENSGGLTNVNWSPEFVAMAVGDYTAQSGVTYKSLKTCTDSFEYVTLVSDGRSNGFVTPKPMDGEESLQRLPTPVAMALSQSALLEYLEQQNKVSPRIVQFLEAEWGIMGLSAMAAKLYRHYSAKQTPGPFRSEWLAPVRGKLEY